LCRIEQTGAEDFRRELRDGAKRSWLYWAMHRAGTGDATAPRQAGLCGSCMSARRVTTIRGSSFLLCHRSLSDDRFARYPQLPVCECPGYDPESEEVKE
jgi:hypothetical protein